MICFCLSRKKGPVDVWRYRTADTDGLLELSQDKNTSLYMREKIAMLKGSLLRRSDGPPSSTYIEVLYTPSITIISAIQ